MVAVQPPCVAVEPLKVGVANLDCDVPENDVEAETKPDLEAVTVTVAEALLPSPVWVTVFVDTETEPAVVVAEYEFAPS